MLGNIQYHNPTKLYFGKEAMKNLEKELENFGKNVLLCYGGGSIKANGIYDQVVTALQNAGKTIVEDGGVMPNPTYEKLLEGIDRARKGNVDFILAVGGGSVCDYAKAVSASVNEEEDPWEKYFVRFENPTAEVLPIGCVLTMVGTGSEMNGGSVITNHEKQLKVGKVFGSELFPKFSILNPEFTYTVPKYQMVSGIYDTFNHICEQYFSGKDDNTSDYLAEGLMRSLIHASRKAVENPKDYEARSNIMWTATWALNTLIGQGKSQDWMVHMLGQAVGACTNATHGMTLASVSLPYYRHILPYGVEKFKRFAVNVWQVETANKTDEEIALTGLDAMAAWMKEIGLVMNITDLGANEDMLDDLTEATLLLDGGYKKLTKEEIRNIFKESL